MRTEWMQPDGPVSSSRRNFLRFTATAALGGGLVLGFGLSARAEVSDDLTTDSPFAPNAFLRIDRSGKVQESGSLIARVTGSFPSGSKGIDEVDVIVQ